MARNGLPLHPLVVRATVVFTPLAALTALAYALLPSWRERLRLPMAVLVGVALVTVVAAYLSGNDFRDSNKFFQDNKQIDEHQDDARLLLFTTIPFAVVGFAAAWLHTRPGAIRVALNALLAVGALAVLVLVFLTGEAGARAVWGGQS